MKKIISEKFGCKIIERESKLFIQYDNGQAVSWIVENEITPDEAKKAILDGESAYKVIMAAQKRRNPVRVI